MLGFFQRHSLVKVLKGKGFEEHVPYISEAIEAADMAEFIEFLQNEVFDAQQWERFCPMLERRMEKKAKFYFQAVANSMN